jgi:hypothetical protein
MMPDRPDNPQTNPASAGAAQPPAGPLPVLSYATPGKFQTGVLRDGRFIALPYGVDLPPECVKCGKPAEVYYPITFTPFLQLRQITLRVGLCHRHDYARRHRIACRACSGALGLAGIASCAMAGLQKLLRPRLDWFDSELALASAVILLPIAVALPFVSYRPLSVQHTNMTTIWLGGAKEPFLEHLSPVEPDQRSIFTREIL